MLSKKFSVCCGTSLPAIAPDLVHGGSLTKTVEKKKFVPNFNVARVKRETDEPKEKKEGGAGSGKQRKKQDSRKDKKEKKERPELIQTMGSVFSEVIYDAQ